MNNIKIINYLEKSIWQKKMEQYESKIMIDSGSDNLISFAIIETPNISVGLSFEESSVYPKVKKSNKADELFIGIDNRLIVLNTTEKKVISRYALQSFFIDVIHVSEFEYIIIEEIGVGRYGINSNRIWFTPTDLIEDFSIKKETISLKTNGEVIELSLLSGETLSQ